LLLLLYRRCCCRSSDIAAVSAADSVSVIPWGPWANRWPAKLPAQKVYHGLIGVASRVPESNQYEMPGLCTKL